MDKVSFQRKIVHGLRWNSIESIGYYTLLTVHQLCLRTISTTPLYGAMGTLFALIYLSIVCVNFGFDLSIGPFFSVYKSCKKLFKKYLLKQLIIQSLIYGIAAFLGMLILAQGYIPIKGMPHISWHLALIIGLLVVTEGTKKSLRIILQFAFLMKVTAVIELWYILFYVTSIWVYYFLWGSISLYTLFLPMLILSSAATVALLIVLYRFYKSLPAENTVQPCAWKQIGWNRIPNYGYQLTRELFTSNFLIPFFAIKFGLSLAAILELVTAFNQFITIIIKKIFGITGQALLSHVKHLRSSYKRIAFTAASTILYRILFAISALALVAYKPIIALKSPAQSSENALIGLLFFLLLFSENFILLYEKWFIIEEKTAYLILFNGILLLTFWGIIQVPYFNSPYLILMILIVLRLIACLMLIFVSYYTWKLTTPFQTIPRYWLYLLFLLMSYFFFCC